MLYFYTNEHRAILTGCSTAAGNSTQTGTRTGNSHIFRMATVMNTNSPVWAGEKTWLTPKTTNIIQPDPTRARAIPAEKWCWMKSCYDDHSIPKCTETVRMHHWLEVYAWFLYTQISSHQHFLLTVEGVVNLVKCNDVSGCQVDIWRSGTFITKTVRISWPSMKLWGGFWTQETA